MILKEDGNYSIKSSELGSDVEEIRQLDSLNHSFGYQTNSSRVSKDYAYRPSQKYESILN